MIGIESIGNTKENEELVKSTEIVDEKEERLQSTKTNKYSVWIQNKFIKFIVIVFLMFMYLVTIAVIEVEFPSSSKIVRVITEVIFMGGYFYSIHWALSKLTKRKTKSKQQNFENINEWINSGTEEQLFNYLENLTSKLNYSNDYMSNMRSISKILSKQSSGNQRLLLADLQSKEKNDTYINIIIMVITGFISNGAIWYLKYSYDNLNTVKKSFVTPEIDYFFEILSVFLFLILLIVHTVKINYIISNKNRLFIEIIKMNLEKLDK
ncbi:hypothetical protein ACWV26_06565 [Rummeliibacillus sp. JY-2-4R]